MVDPTVIFNMILRFGGNRSAVALSKVGPATVPSDRHNPGFDRPATIPPVKIPQDPQESLLRHILCFVMLAEHAIAEQVHLISKSLYELRDRALVALHALVD